VHLPGVGQPAGSRVLLTHEYGYGARPWRRRKTNGKASSRDLKHTSPEAPDDESPRGQPRTGQRRCPAELMAPPAMLQPYIAHCAGDRGSLGSYPARTSQHHIFTIRVSGFTQLYAVCKPGYVFRRQGKSIGIITCQSTTHCKNSDGRSSY